jgi:hypothetical protein
MDELEAWYSLDKVGMVPLVAALYLLWDYGEGKIAQM